MWSPLFNHAMRCGKLCIYSVSLCQFVYLPVCVCSPLQYAATDSLDADYCPWLRGKPRATSGVSGMGMATAGASPAGMDRVTCTV